ncbi:MAG: hypothetical protein QM628_15720 [Propionicimonas sp.]
MQKGDLVTGRRYALRQFGAPDTLVKVRFLGVVHKRHAKVRFEDGDLAGLDDWVTTRELVCPWVDRQRMLRDEERAARLRAACHESWDEVHERAISMVFEASGEENGFTRTWDTSEGRATRLWSRAGFDGSPLDDDPLNYVDRHGEWHLSFETALKAAKGFAGRGPEMVTMYVSDWEDRLKAEGFQPGRRHMHDVLRDFAPGLALARSWVSDPARTAEQEEIERLRKLVLDAASVLNRAGLTKEADRVHRALSGG